MPTFRFGRSKNRYGSQRSGSSYGVRQRPVRGSGRRSFLGGGNWRFRLFIALVIGLFAFAKYMNSSEYNDITGTAQRVAMSPQQEIALGLQAVPTMIKQHGGLEPDPQAQALVDQIGERILRRSDAGSTQYQFEFHLLNDDQTINAFALPGGQVFITEALFKKFENEHQLAGVLAHEIAHVVARHGAQQMAKQQLTQGLVSAAVVGAGDYSAGQMAGMVGKMVNMKYGRSDEIESDLLGVRFMHQAGYDPNELIGVMEILASAGGGRQPEFMSSHPSPDNRVERIKEAIAGLR